MKYPSWICSDCGHKAQPDKKRINENATWHESKCDVCKETKPVTQTRDFGWPDPHAFIWKKK